MSDPTPIIDYPWEEFRVDFDFFWPRDEKSLGTVSREIPSHYQEEGDTRALVLNEVFAYLKAHNKILLAGGILKESGDSIQIRYDALQTLHYFLIRQPPENWFAAPPPEFLIAPYDQG